MSLAEPLRRRLEPLIPKGTHVYVSDYDLVIEGENLDYQENIKLLQRLWGKFIACTPPEAVFRECGWDGRFKVAIAVGKSINIWVTNIGGSRSPQPEV